MANYRPKSTTILATAVDSGVITHATLSTQPWAMGLYKATALSPTGRVLPSGTVLVWESTKVTTATPDHITLADTEGRFGVTVRANVNLTIKFFGA